MKAYLALVCLVIPLIANAQAGDNREVDEMVQVGDIYVDKYEAPNIAGELPFVMFSFDDAECWCQARGKRLLTDAEWEMAAGGPLSLPYVYGTVYDSLACNGNKSWRAYNQNLLNDWPGIPLCNMSAFPELIDSVRNVSANASLAADHVLWLYQADAAGSDVGCVSYYGAYDMNGNVQEWTRRSDGGNPGFHGNLKGGYWAQMRTIQQNLTAHGDDFRFYNTGFRCAADSITTSVGTIKNNEAFSVYPNPVSQYLYVSCKGQLPVTLRIASVLGNVILRKDIKNEPARIDISALPSGVYIVSVMGVSRISGEYKIIKY